MNLIDLVVVEYPQNVGKEICYAPRHEVEAGDTVMTSFGEGTVKETLFTYSEDEVFQFFARNQKIRPVLFKPIKYDDAT